MNRTLLSFILILITFHVSYSQSNFQEGYVKKINGEIAQGLIDNRDWAKNPKEIIFKSHETAVEQSFNVEELFEFGVNNDLYQSAVVKVSPLARHERNKTPTYEFEEKKVFLRRLITGSKELFHFQSDLQKDHFYIKQGIEYELLEYKEYVKEVIGDTKLIAKNRKYIGQLLIYLSGCEGSQKIVSSSKYATQSLKNVFYKYYECVGEPVVREKKQQLLTRMNLLSGVSITKVNFKSEINAYNFLDEGLYDVSIQPVLGIGVDFIIPRDRQKWGISSELLYKSYKVEWSHDVYTNPEVYRLGEYKLGLSYLQLNIMARFAMPISKEFSVIIKGGLANGVVINEINEKNTLFKNYVDERNVEGKALDAIRSLELGFNVGLGIEYKRLIVNWRLERTKGVSTYSGLTSPTLYNYFILGFQMSKI